LDHANWTSPLAELANYASRRSRGDLTATSRKKKKKKKKTKARASEMQSSSPHRKYQRADPKRTNRSSGVSRFRAASAARKNLTPVTADKRILSLVAIRNDSDRNAHAAAVGVAATAKRQNPFHALARVLVDVIKRLCTAAPENGLHGFVSRAKRMRVASAYNAISFYFASLSLSLSLSVRVASPPALRNERKKASPRCFLVSHSLAFLLPASILITLARASRERAVHLHA